MDKKVTEYIEKQSPEQKQILKKLRKIILSLKIKEKMHIGVPFYEGKYYLYSGKNKDVNLGISVKGMKKEDVKLLEGKGKYMRHLKFKDVKEINEKEVKKILKKAGKCVDC